ncbi:hypothetical protein V6N11_064406 [Hibiscus sabdariffa]|uniref:Uncharacterized protein n=2 Tax=Hibiscus sabdariffa TaxID=183260 RepID=A0ABR2BYX4_9ROSI
MEDKRICEENVRAGKYGPWLKASSTWVKHDEGYRKKDVGSNKLQIKEHASTIMTTSDKTNAMDNESHRWGDSPKAIDSTRQTTRDKVQTLPSPIKVMMQESDDFLGLMMKAGYQGIVSDFTYSQQGAC